MHCVSLALFGAKGAREAPRSLARAVLRRTLIRWSVAYPAILHDWAVVGTAAVARAALFDVVVSTELHSFGRISCPTRWPSWGIFPAFLLLLATLVAVFLALLGSLFGKLGLPNPTLLAPLAFATTGAFARQSVTLARVTDTLVYFSLPEGQVLLDFLHGFL